MVSRLSALWVGENLLEAIFDRKTRLVAWLSYETNLVYDLRNRPIAHIFSGAVYTYQSQHLGYFDRGFFRDRSGRAVAFIREHSGGMLTAIAPLPPISPPRPAIAPAPPIPPAPPAMPMACSWSVLDWKAFIGNSGHDLSPASQSESGRAPMKTLVQT